MLDHDVRIVRSAPVSVELVAAHTIDADGDPRAYHPGDTGLDTLAHAGAPGNWWALVTDDGTPAGAPIVQGEGDPAPGHYVSATTLADESKDRRDPRRYVDAGVVPYVVLPRSFADAHGIRLGDFAWVEMATGADSAGEETRDGPGGVAAIFADVGPEGRIGEGSIALAARLGLPTSPRTGGTLERRVRYVLFPGSGDGRPRSLEEIADNGARLAQERNARDASACR